MTQRATHRNETICIGCLGDYRPARSRVRRSGSSSFCTSCRVSNGEPRWSEPATEPTPAVAVSTNASVALALIDALGFWLDA